MHLIVTVFETVEREYTVPWLTKVDEWFEERDSGAVEFDWVAAGNLIDVTERDVVEVRVRKAAHTPVNQQIQELSHAFARLARPID